MTRVSVMTYNIYMGGRKGAPLNDVVRRAAPVVLMVNESPKWPFVWKPQCRRLVRAWRMKMVTGGRPAGSNLIAVAPGIAVKSSGSEVLRQPWFQPRRGIAWAQLRIEGQLVGLVSCHLSLERERRLREVQRVIEIATHLRGPVVVAGDLNETPNGPSWEQLRRAGFVDHGSKKWLTFPAEHPDRRIDALLVRGAVDVVHHGDPGLSDELLASASDHRPVLAVLDIGETISK